MNENTGANISWPSKPGLSSQEQQLEAIEIIKNVMETEQPLAVLLSMQVNLIGQMENFQNLQSRQQVIMD